MKYLSRDGIYYTKKGSNYFTTVLSTNSLFVFFSILMTVEQALKIPKSGACCFS